MRAVRTCVSITLFFLCCLLFCIVTFVVSCSYLPADMSDLQAVDVPSVGPGGSGNILGRFEEEIDALEAKGFKRFVLKPVAADGDLFGDRGILGEPVRAQSGERLEIRWEGFFPRYRLYYFPSPGHQGVAIGECRFADGCNSGLFFAPDNDGNGVPDNFRLVQWTSIDYGRDDGIPGYLDRYRYIYDVENDGYYIWYDLLIYSCPPPLSVPPDTCRTTCESPYETRAVSGRTYPKIFKTRLMENRPLLVRPRE